MAVSNRCVALVGALLVVGSLAACSDDDKPSAASSFSSSKAPTTTSSASSSSSSASSAEPAGTCDAAAPPTSAVRVTDAEGDFNGDQITDSLKVYGTGTDDQPAPYHVYVELGGGARTVDDVIADAVPDNNSNVQALGGADITASAGLPPDGSGAEAFVTIGSGASASIVGVYQLVDCVLARLTGPQGQQPSAFAIGGSVTHLDGLRCDGAAGGQRLVQLSATSNDGVTYATTESRLEVTNGQFTVTSTVNGSLDVNDPQLQSFARLDCPGVQSP